MNTVAEAYMRRALDLARLGEGRTRPNPPVGAVIVNAGQIVGEGYHAAAGEAHAEIHALRQAEHAAIGSDVYVSLEPCAHVGRTGPCADALIQAQVKRVVVGTLDPNPLVQGRGIERLRNAGIDVVSGLLERECQWLLGPFSTRMTQSRPLVTLKSALTLDGQTATSLGESQWITGEQSRLDVHYFRNRVDAIMVGVGTVLTDNPRLTTRIPEGGTDPLRVIIDSRLRTPLEAAALTVNSSAGVLVATTPQADRARIRELEKTGVNVVVCDEIEGEGVDLRNLMQHLASIDIMHIMLEGGATLNRGTLKAGLVDRIRFYLAPMLFGGSDGKGVFLGNGVADLSAAHRLRLFRTEQLGDDLLVEGELIRCLPA
jgi:diaminohydroxyphosphoribosylaminopyrimidine deaminase/5-amino-6-(5-phosphoribosylamino)uracil reductase